MDISDTRKCNLFNLEMLTRYLSALEKSLIGHYEELLEDGNFLNDIKNQILDIRKKWGFKKEIFCDAHN
jgi:hypothetical protein